MGGKQKQAQRTKGNVRVSKHLVCRPCNFIAFGVYLISLTWHIRFARVLFVVQWDHNNWTTVIRCGSLMLICVCWLKMSFFVITSLESLLSIFFYKLACSSALLRRRSNLLGSESMGLCNSGCVFSSIFAYLPCSIPKDRKTSAYCWMTLGQVTKFKLPNSQLTECEDYIALFFFSALK